MALRRNYLIEKRNILNELRTNSMTLQELRFFSIYLSKINSRDISTRKVIFPIEDFRKIMELDYKVNIAHTKNVINGLLCKIVNIPLEKGGYTAFQLFKECTVSQDSENEWYVEIDAHDKALPLMFEFKDRYFTYELWNALKLKSVNQLRMYELLKQYEIVGERIISITELRELMGIEKDEYVQFNNFKIRVLDACQRALEEYTDIKYTYEPAGKRGPRGKILKLKFKIFHNENYIDQISLDEFLDEPDISSFKYERLDFIADACDREFTELEIQVLYNLMLKIIPHGLNMKIDMYDYLKRKYDELKWRASKTEVKNRFGYLKAIIEVDIAALY